MSARAAPPRGVKPNRNRGVRAQTHRTGLEVLGDRSRASRDLRMNLLSPLVAEGCPAAIIAVFTACRHRLGVHGRAHRRHPPVALPTEEE
eukprot:674409-Prymnesium_polylepis.2